MVYYIHTVGAELQTLTLGAPGGHRLPSSYIRPRGVIETHYSEQAAQHAVSALNNHNIRNGHPERYTFTYSAGGV
jgi:hypothetical protein